MRRKAFVCMLVTDDKQAARMTNAVLNLPWPPTKEDIAEAAMDEARPVVPGFPASVVVTSFAWIGPVVDE